MLQIVAPAGNRQHEHHRSRDMAFPRLNALSFWLFLGSGIFMYAALAGGIAPDAGWFDYVPLADRRFDPVSFASRLKVFG